MKVNDFSKKLNNDTGFENDVSNVVEQNAGYYIDKWKKASNPLKFAGWNWAAFLLSPIWLAYRHMYFWATIYFLLLVVTAAVASILPAIIYYTALTEESLLIWRIASPFLVALIFGWKGNALYGRHVHKLIAAKSDTSKPVAPLFSKTGRSLTSAILVFSVAVTFLYPATVWMSSWMEHTTVPPGVYIHEEENPPQSLLDTLGSEIAVFEKYSDSINLLYIGEEPIGNSRFEVVLSYRENAQSEWTVLSERSYSFFSSNRVSLNLLDAENPLTDTGEYNVEVFIDENSVGTSRFDLIL